jgi:hypothetical protein
MNGYKGGLYQYSRQGISTGFQKLWRLKDAYLNDGFVYIAENGTELVRD